MNPTLFFEELNPYRNYDFNTIGKLQLNNIKNRLMVNRTEMEKPISDVYVSTKEIDGIHRTIQKLNRSSPLNKDYNIKTINEDLDDSLLKLLADSPSSNSKATPIRKTKISRAEVESSSHQEEMSFVQRPKFLLADDRFRLLYKRFNNEKNSLRQMKKRDFFEQGSENVPYLESFSREENILIEKEPVKAKIDTGRFEKGRSPQRLRDPDQIENYSQERFSNKLYRLYNVDIVGIRGYENQKIKRFQNSRSHSPRPQETQKPKGKLVLPAIK